MSAIEELSAAYRREDGYTLIELQLGDVRQLFDNRDPAPFRHRDLDQNAAEYIEEAPAGARLKLMIYLPETDAGNAAAGEITHAVQGYFRRQGHLARRCLADLLATGRIALLVGLTFLATCSGLALLVGSQRLGWLGEVLEEGLIIIGWVALWRPAEIFLYAWWPLRRRWRQVGRLATLPVEIRSSPAGRRAGAAR